MRSLLIESLTLTDKGILLLALKSLVDDQTFDFSTAFDKCRFHESSLSAPAMMFLFSTAIVLCIG